MTGVKKHEHNFIYQNANETVNICFTFQYSKCNNGPLLNKDKCHFVATACLNIQERLRWSIPHTVAFEKMVREKNYMNLYVELNSQSRFVLNPLDTMLT